MKIFVEHRGYGCDTGCCGHVITMEDDAERFLDEKFCFAHADGDAMQWAKGLIEGELGPEHVADLDWSRCCIVNWDVC